MSYEDRTQDVTSGSAQQGGVITARTSFPSVHEAIGVLGAISVASACVLQGSVAQQVDSWQAESGQILLCGTPNRILHMGLEDEASSSEVVLTLQAYFAQPDIDAWKS